ncbi:hypothetical protein MYX04_05790 [Nitrospiraceae bacterium AH_259_D15_M11_P09]|nr:hypothetical protein [Nitrospiraceae bacterium AH_259_D15_M11_P09]
MNYLTALDEPQVQDAAKSVRRLEAVLAELPTELQVQVWKHIALRLAERPQVSVKDMLSEDTQPNGLQRPRPMKASGLPTEASR